MTTPCTKTELQHLAATVLQTAGTNTTASTSVARALVAAEMDGLSSHGLSRLPFYADQVMSGKVDGTAEPTIGRHGAVLTIDAHCGFAYPAVDAGIAEAITRVRETGVIAMGIANSHHFGAAGYHVERLAEDGLIALAFSNSPAAIAPWGGAEPLFGTNPIAFAAPRQQHAPLVIDLSLSEAARGKVMVAKRQGEAIPKGWALDARGQPTTDPDAALAGSMMPLGGAKGAALALMVELLTAGLSGSNFAFEASSFFDAEGEPPRVAQLFLVLDPGAFGGAERFAARIAHLLGAIGEQPGTRLPGDKRLAKRQRAFEVGIDVPETLYRELQQRTGRAR